MVNYSNINLTAPLGLMGKNEGEFIMNKGSGIVPLISNVLVKRHNIRNE